MIEFTIKLGRIHLSMSFLRIFAKKRLLTFNGPERRFGVRWFLNLRKRIIIQNFQSIEK